MGVLVLHDHVYLTMREIVISRNDGFADMYNGHIASRTIKCSEGHSVQNDFVCIERHSDHGVMNLNHF